MNTTVVLSLEDRLALVEEQLSHQRSLIESQGKLLDAQARHNRRLQVSLAATGAVLTALGD